MGIKSIFEGPIDESSEYQVVFHELLKKFNSMNDLATAENRGIEAADYANGKGTPIRARSRSRGTTDVRVSRFEVTFYLIFGHFAP